MSLRHSLESLFAVRRAKVCVAGFTGSRRIEQLCVTDECRVGRSVGRSVESVGRVGRSAGWLAGWLALRPLPPRDREERWRERRYGVWNITVRVFLCFLFLFLKERLAVENGREKMLKVPCAESGDLGRSTKGASRVELSWVSRSLEPRAERRDGVRLWRMIRCQRPYHAERTGSRRLPEV